MCSSDLPLAKTDQIVIVGDSSSGVTNEVSKLVSQLPPAVQALTGVDLSGVGVTSVVSVTNHKFCVTFLNIVVRLMISNIMA